MSQEAIAPPNIAFNPTFAKSLFLDGAIALIPPIWMPIEEKLANPHNAYVDMIIALSLINPLLI